MTKATDWIGAALGIVGVMTVVIGVYTCCTNLREKRSSEDVGSICLNKRLMGLFEAKKPWGWLMGRDVRILELPTLYGVLRAGEANKWTSALVEGIYDNLDDEVCWKQLYEQFFLHLAWEEPSAPSAIKDARLGIIMNRASTIIEGEKKKATKTPSILDLEIKIDQSSLKKRWCLVWLRDLIKKLVLCIARKCQLWCCEKRCGNYEYHRSHNRKLLYEKILDRAPVLQDCVRLLEKIDGTSAIEDPLYGYESIWDRHLRPIWILGKRPCLPVSTEQLVGFCLAFGINLRRRGKDKFYGSGAYGLMVNVSSQDDYYLRIHVTHPRRGPRLQASKGNGYSILFAKLMACGCLPFALKPGLTKSIHVNQDIHNAIRWGLSIKDGRDYPKAPSINFLADLPGQTNDDYYCVRGLIVHFTYGHIYDSHGKPLQPDDPGRWTWAKAVAGIAFGGFIPQATRNLVSAVQFTVLGADIIGGTQKQLMEDIEILINEVHTWDEKYELFGTYIARRQIASNAQNITYVFDPRDIADAVAIFSRYATLLERFLGIIAEREGTTTNYKDSIYNALSCKLQQSYRQAVHKYTGRYPASGMLNGSLRDEVKKLRKFRDAKVTTASRIDSCAVLARILILAWTYQVNLVRWRGETESQADFYSIAKHQGFKLLTARGIQNSNKLGVLGL